MAKYEQMLTDLETSKIQKDKRSRIRQHYDEQLRLAQLEYDNKCQRAKSTLETWRNKRPIDEFRIIEAKTKSELD